MDIFITEGEALVAALVILVVQVYLDLYSSSDGSYSSSTTSSYSSGSRAMITMIYLSRLGNGSKITLPISG